jgi:hypothetical protein
MKEQRASLHCGGGPIGRHSSEKTWVWACTLGSGGDLGHMRQCKTELGTRGGKGLGMGKNRSLAVGIAALNINSTDLLLVQLDPPRICDSGGRTLPVLLWVHVQAHSLVLTCDHLQV